MGNKYDEYGRMIKPVSINGSNATVGTGTLSASFEEDPNGEGVLRTTDVAPYENNDTLLQGIKTIITAGTRVQLGGDVDCKEVLITALHSNTGFIYIGTDAVSSSAYGKRLRPEESISIKINNLNLVYLDSSVNGEGVSFLGVN